MQEIGLFCEAVQEYQVSKTNEQIQIFSAFANDLNSFYASCNDTRKRAKHTPMSEAFPQAFPKEKPMTDIEKAYNLARKLDSLVDTEE